MNRFVRGCVVAAVVVGVVFVAGGVVGETVEKHEDASGNDRDLTEVNGPGNASGSMEKFGGGYALNGSGFVSAGSEAIFEENRDFSLTVAGKLDVNGTTTFVESVGNGGSWEVRMLSDGTQPPLQFVVDGVIVCSIGPDPVWDRGQVSFWLSVNQRSLQQEEVEMEAYNETGVVQGSCSETYAGQGVGGEMTFGTEAEPPQAEVYEARFWSEVVDSQTLGQIADPADESFRLEPQGGEEGVWFMEPVTLPGDPDPLNGASVWTVEESDPVGSGTVEVFVEAFNASGDPLEPGGNVSLIVQRVNGSVVEYLNVSSGGWTFEAVENQMGAVSASLFSLTLDRGVLEGSDSSVRLTGVVEVAEEPRAPGDLTFGSYDWVEESTVSHDWLQDATIGSLTAGDAVWLVLWFLAFVFASKWEWWVASGFAMVGALGTFVPEEVVGPERAAFVVVFFLASCLLHMMHEWRKKKGSEAERGLV